MASPLVFLREKPENEGLGFKYGLRPRLDSAPSLVQASDGVLPFTQSLFFLLLRLIQAHPSFYRWVSQSLLCTKFLAVQTVHAVCVFALVESIPAFLFDLQFSAVCQSRQNFIDRGHRIVITRQFEALFLKFVPNLIRCHTSVRRSRYVSNGISYPQFGEVSTPRQTHEREDMRDGFSQSDDSNIFVTQFNFKLIALCGRGSKFRIQCLKSFIEAGFHKESMPYV